MTPAMISNSFVGGGMKAIYQVGRQIKQQEHLVYHRLLSIKHDSLFVQEFLKYRTTKNTQYEILANLRCGAWYYPNFDSTCYFKSTDGHCGHWTFNLRRLNPHVATLAATHGSVVIIDSTRKGKKYPDAFNRTIPIWTSVINRSIYILRYLKKVYLEGGNQDFNISELSPSEYDRLIETIQIPENWNTLFMPSWIPNSEISQIEEKLELFCKNLLLSPSMKSTLEEIDLVLQKPLRCSWVCPSSFSLPQDHTTIADELDLNDSFYWIILLCPSEEQDVQQEKLVWYVQGAADDEESWSHGLTYPIFWKNVDQLLSNEAEIDSSIQKILQDSREQLVSGIQNLPSTIESEPLLDRLKTEFTCIIPDFLWIGSSVEANTAQIWNLFDGFVNCSPIDYGQVSSSASDETSQTHPKRRYIHLKTPHAKGKQQKFKVSGLLPAVLEFVSSSWNSGESPRMRIAIHSLNDIETCIALCVGILAEQLDEDGKTFLPERRSRQKVNKPLIKHFVLHMAKLSPQSIPSYMISDLNRYFLTSESWTPSSILEKQQQSKQSVIQR